MSNRYEWINGETYCDSDQMYDNETGNKTQPVYVADLLNEQDQKIKELEHRLSNCIEPKFKIGQKVWVVDNLSEKIYLGEVDFIEAQKFKRENFIWYQVEYFDECTMSGPFEEPFTFATEEEARKHLEELKK